VFKFEDVMSFKTLSKAYNELVKGRYRPDLIALNPKEWEWMVKMYYPYQEENRIVVTSHILEGEHLNPPEWGLFHGCLFVLKESVQVNHVWMWRLEPHFEFYEYDLRDAKSTIRAKYTLTESSYGFGLDVSMGKRLNTV
jgi:hypothetical protein